MVCIYCKTTDAQCFRGVEHVIPQSFGTFGDQTPTLKSVCDGCNAFFKKELDQILARETIEGLTRYNKGIYSSETRPQNRLKIALADPHEVGDAAGIAAWVDGQTGNLMPRPLQVVFRKSSTGEYVPVFEKDLRSLDWKKEGYSDKGIKIFASSEDEHARAVQLLSAIGIKYEVQSRIASPSPGKSSDGKFLVEVSSTIDHVEKRGFSKILFNFACKYLGEEEVRKTEWDKARHYIRFNAEPLKARISSKPFWDEERSSGLRFPDDSYNLRIENHQRGIVGALEMFNLYNYEILLVEGYKLPQELGMSFTPDKRPIRAKTARSLGITPS
jgi:hypothetical protein